MEDLECPPNAWFFDPTWVSIPTGISTGARVKCGCGDLQIFIFRKLCINVQLHTDVTVRLSLGLRWHIHTSAFYPSPSTGSDRQTDQVTPSVRITRIYVMLRMRCGLITKTRVKYDGLSLQLRQATAKRNSINTAATTQLAGGMMRTGLVESPCKPSPSVSLTAASLSPLPSTADIAWPSICPLPSTHRDKSLLRLHSDTIWTGDHWPRPPGPLTLRHVPPLGRCEFKRFTPLKRYAHILQILQILRWSAVCRCLFLVIRPIIRRSTNCRSSFFYRFGQKTKLLSEHVNKTEKMQTSSKVSPVMEDLESPPNAWFHGGTWRNDRNVNKYEQLQRK